MISGRAARACHDDQAGVTLVELVVTMFVFTVFLTIVLSSVIGLTRASTQAEVIARSSSQVLAVFQRFDRQIRYADSINFPGVGSSGARYVEFRTPSQSSATGITTCTQWRYDPSMGVIESRQWKDVASPAPSSWAVRLKTVFDDGANYPFALTPASSGGSAMQQLTLKITAGNATVQGAAITTNFVARNSSIQSPSNAGATSLVCSAGSMRP